MNLEKIRAILQAKHADAWIIVDYENRNPMTTAFLGNKMLTRKIFLVIPQNEKPYLITHAIDTVFLSDAETAKNFDLRVYHTWQEMLELEKTSFKGYKKVLMDISEKGLLPGFPSPTSARSITFVPWVSLSILQPISFKASPPPIANGLTSSSSKPARLP
jgi:hypothetical protein